MPEELFVEQFWADLEPLEDTDQFSPASREKVLEHLFDEFRFVFSGMLYGYSFFYTPGDNQRGVEEQFELTPLSEIPKGDPSLRILETRIEKARLLVRASYALKGFQQSLRNGWESSALPFAGGIGEASLYRGVEERRKAIEAGIKEAIRNYLRERVFNKPKEVRGELVLWSAPRIIVDSGAYKATVRIKLRVEEIVPYSVF